MLKCIRYLKFVSGVEIIPGDVFRGEKWGECWKVYLGGDEEYFGDGWYYIIGDYFIIAVDIPEIGI